MKSPYCAFPQHEAPRLLDVVAELEADGGVLGQRAVVNLERRPRARQRGRAARALSPVTASCSTAWRWLKVPRSTSSPVSRIGDAVLENRGKGQLLGRRPVDRPLVRLVEHRRAALARAFELAVHREALRHRQQLAIERGEPIQRHRGLHAARGAARRRLGQRRHVVLFRLERRVGLLRARVMCCLTSASACVARQPPPSASCRAYSSRTVGWPRDDLVDLRLRERRLVALVVAVAAIADEIDQEVELEACADTPTPAAPPRCTRPDRRR